MTRSSKEQQILDGAGQEFLRNGFAATTVDGIAATAGVSKATIYSYFKGKEGLFKALVERLAGQQLDFIANFQKPEASPREVLRNIASGALEREAMDPAFQAFRRMLIGESDRFPEVSKIFIETVMKPGLAQITGYLASQPQLKIKDPEAVARIFIGAVVHYSMVQENLGGKELIPLERDRLVDSLVDLIIPPNAEL